MLISVENVRNLLIANIGEPDDIDSFNDYVNFVINNNLVNETDLYCEFHHILPQCILKNDIAVKLTYNNHCQAHLLLFLAYNKNCFHHTLNFMKPEIHERGEAYKTSLSNARKDAWKKFKLSEKYSDYIALRREITSRRMRSGFAKELSARRYEKNPNAKAEISQRFKELWPNKKYKEAVRKSMTVERNTPEAKKRISQASITRYQKMSSVQRQEFKDTMRIVNSCQEKRTISGIKIKEKWKDPEFLRKMKNRKHGSNSKSMKEKWKDPETKQMMLDKRKKTQQENKIKNETN